MNIEKRRPKKTSPTRGEFPWRAMIRIASEEKQPPLGNGGGIYFRLVLIVVNLSFMVLPRLFTTVMIARAMPAAIRPYSIAVAPDSSDQNFQIMLFKTRLRFNFKLRCLNSTSENVRGATFDPVNPGTATFAENRRQKFQKLKTTEP